jgi:hypothetical protein
LTKDNPNKNKLLNLGALALAGYGFLILIFWWVAISFLRKHRFSQTGLSQFEL